MAALLAGRSPPCEVALDVFHGGVLRVGGMVFTATASGQLELRAGLLQALVPSTWRVARFEEPAVRTGRWRVHMIG